MLNALRNWNASKNACQRCDRSGGKKGEEEQERSDSPTRKSESEAELAKEEVSIVDGAQKR